MQYGYGDESNSVLLQCRSKILFDHLVNSIDRAPLAERIEVTGHVFYRDLIFDDDYQMQTKRKKRLQHKLDANIKALKANIPTQFRKAGGASVIVNLDPEDGVKSGTQEGPLQFSDYYGAYLWVMFAICDENNPNEEETRQYKYAAWRNLLPYFVHGNIAEEKSYHHVSHLVAWAAAMGARKILKAHKDVKLRYISRYRS